MICIIDSHRRSRVQPELSHYHQHMNMLLSTLQWGCNIPETTFSMGSRPRCSSNPSLHHNHQRVQLLNITRAQSARLHWAVSPFERQRYTTTTCLEARESDEWRSGDLSWSSETDLIKRWQTASVELPSQSGIDSPAEGRNVCAVNVLRENEREAISGTFIKLQGEHTAKEFSRAHQPTYFRVILFSMSL